jgi:membrane associated rhomboid family serine protease
MRPLTPPERIRTLSGMAPSDGLSFSDPPASTALAEPDEPASSEREMASEPDAFIGPLFDGRQAREWALVLQSQAIAYVMFHAGGSWLLRVAPADHPRAIEAIDLYEAENENWPPEPVRDRPRHPPSGLIALAFFSALLFFLYVTGPVSSGSAWFIRGRLDAAILFQEPWRAVTALTLHADGQHVLGNALSGTIFGSMLSRRIGPGGALLAIVVAGALGNLANGIYHASSGHRSIGASTAVFAAVGMLAAVQTVLVATRPDADAESRRFGLVDILAPLVGGLALLGSLGSGRHTDLTAHGFGFAAGILVGIVAGLLVRRRDSLPSTPLQVAVGLGAAGLVAASWALASL